MRHNNFTCEKKSTNFTFKNYKVKFKKWCKSSTTTKETKKQNSTKSKCSVFLLKSNLESKMRNNTTKKESVVLKRNLKSKEMFMNWKLENFNNKFYHLKVKMSLWCAKLILSPLGTNFLSKQLVFKIIHQIALNHQHSIHFKWSIILKDNFKETIFWTKVKSLFKIKSTKIKEYLSKNQIVNYPTLTLYKKRINSKAS